MASRTANIKGGICPIIFGAASSLKCVSHQNRMNPVTQVQLRRVFSARKRKWLTRSFGLGGVMTRDWALFLRGELRVGCLLCSLLVAGYGWDWVVTWKRLLSMMCQWRESQGELNVSSTFPRWSSAGVGSGAELPEVSLLFGKCTNSCAIPWHHAGQVFFCVSWWKMAWARRCSVQPRASTAKTSKSPCLLCLLSIKTRSETGEMQMTGMHSAPLQALRLGG